MPHVDWVANVQTSAILTRRIMISRALSWAVPMNSCAPNTATYSVSTMRSVSTRINCMLQ